MIDAEAIFIFSYLRCTGELARDAVVDFDHLRKFSSIRWFVNDLHLNFPLPSCHTRRMRKNDIAHGAVYERSKKSR